MAILEVLGGGGGECGRTLVRFKGGGGVSRMNKYTYLCVVFAFTNYILLGYDEGAMGEVGSQIKETMGLTSVQEEVLVGTLSVFSLIGSLAASKTSDVIGRRYTIFLAASTSLVGTILVGLAPSYPFLLAGRIVSGIGVGYSLVIVPVYSAELFPAMNQGFLTSLPEVLITFGILLGYILNYTLSGLPTHLNWRVMLGLAALPAIGIFLGAVAMPESPLWLAMKGKSKEAKQVVEKTSSSSTEADRRFQEITKEADSAASLGQTSGGGDWCRQGVWKELLITPSKPIRRVLVVAVGINLFMEASGNDAVIYYCHEVFRAAGIQGEKQLFCVEVVMGLANMLFALLSTFYRDRFGRRPFLLLGTAGMMASLAGLGLGSMYLEHSSSKPTWVVVLCVMAVCADVSFFSIGLGPIRWSYSWELSRMRMRAQGLALVISVNRLVSGAVSMSFLSISKKITFGGMFFVLAGVMLAATVFVYLLSPDIEGKTLMETIFEDHNTNASLNCDDNC